MSISHISSNTSVAQPAQTNSVKKPDNHEAVAVTADMKTAPKTKADTVTISKQAAQLAAQQYSPQEEAKETSTQKAVESAQGKK